MALFGLKVKQRKRIKNKMLYLGLFGVKTKQNDKKKEKNKK